MSYQRDRDDFIVRMTMEGLDWRIIAQLLRSATTLNRYAELACSSEAADKDRVPCPASTTISRKIGGTVRDLPRKASGACLCDDYPAGSHAAGKHSTIPRITVKGDRLEKRVIAAMPEGWAADFQGDPRGYVLRVLPPSYAERNKGRDRHNLDTIGVPSGPSGLRF